MSKFFTIVSFITYPDALSSSEFDVERRAIRSILDGQHLYSLSRLPSLILICTTIEMEQRASLNRRLSIPKPSSGPGLGTTVANAALGGLVSNLVNTGASGKSICLLYCLLLCNNLLCRCRIRQTRRP